MEEGLDSAVKKKGQLHELGEELSQDSQADSINNSVGQVVGQSVTSESEIEAIVEQLYLSGAIVTDYADERIDQSLPISN